MNDLKVDLQLGTIFMANKVLSLFEFSADLQ
jgi:hypothetical protein